VGIGRLFEALRPFARQKTSSQPFKGCIMECTPNNMRKAEVNVIGNEEKVRKQYSEKSRSAPETLIVTVHNAL
jgi:hypothetical protein